MKLQEGGGAGTSRDFAGVRSLGDAEQQADHQIAPEQPGELCSNQRENSAVGPSQTDSGKLDRAHELMLGPKWCSGCTGFGALFCEQVHL